jgi:MFS family permease
MRPGTSGFAAPANAVTQTIAWCVIFFFASAGASAAYLTVSEIFPLEVRAQASAVFFAIAQCFGTLGPVIYGHLIGNGDNPKMLFFGYLLGAAVMIVGGLVEIALVLTPSRSPWRTSPGRCRWCAWTGRATSRR